MVIVIGGAFMLLTLTADIVNPIQVPVISRSLRAGPWKLRTMTCPYQRKKATRDQPRRIGHARRPAAVLAPRRKTRQLMVGNVGVGSDYPVSVQSMCTTKTHDVNATLQQIAELTASGCDIVRVACPRQEDADALATIAKKSQIPVIADIHFQPRYIFAAHRRRLRRGARQPRQHQGVRRPGQGGREGGR